MLVRLTGRSFLTRLPDTSNAAGRPGKAGGSPTATRLGSVGQHGHYSAEQVEDVIVSVTASEVLAGCRRTLGLPEQHGGIVDDVLLAGLLRRSAGMHCPCSRATLRASVLECTQALSTDHAALPQRIDDAIEALTLGGDLLELDDVATEDSEVRQTWLFATPPGFVIRPNGAAFLFGVVPDQDAFLPSSLGIRVLHDGFARSIEPRPGENLRSASDSSGPSAPSPNELGS